MRTTMRRHRVVSILLLVLMVGAMACRPPAKQQLSESIKKDLAALQSEKTLIEDKLRDIERSRSLLEQNNRDIRHAIESIQNALNNMQARLDAMEAAPPTAPVSAKRLPPAVSITLAVIVIFCVLIYLKLRSMRARERKRAQAQEVAGDSTAGPSQTQTPNP